MASYGNGYQILPQIANPPNITVGNNSIVPVPEHLNVDLVVKRLADDAIALQSCHRKRKKADNIDEVVSTMQDIQLQLSLKTKELQEKLFDSKTFQLDMIKTSEMNSNGIGNLIKEALATEKVQEEHFRLLQMSIIEAQKLLNKLISII